MITISKYDINNNKPTLLKNNLNKVFRKVISIFIILLKLSQSHTFIFKKGKSDGEHSLQLSWGWSWVKSTMSIEENLLNSLFLSKSDLDSFLIWQDFFPTQWQTLTLRRGKNRKLDIETAVQTRGQSVTMMNHHTLVWCLILTNLFWMKQEN